MTDEDGFLRRWSRRKTEEKSSETPEIASPRGAAAPEIVESPKPETEAVAPEDLPDIDSLDESSDFTAFMRDGVPEELKQIALRRLWRLDPIFNEVDGLVEYGEDFSRISLAAVKSIYQVGKGMVTEDDEELAEAEGDAVSAGEAEKAAALEESPEPLPAESDGSEEADKTQ